MALRRPHLCVFSTCWNPMDLQGRLKSHFPDRLFQTPQPAWIFRAVQWGATPPVQRHFSGVTRRPHSEVPCAPISAHCFKGRGRQHSPLIIPPPPAPGTAPWVYGPKSMLNWILLFWCQQETTNFNHLFHPRFLNRQYICPQARSTFGRLKDTSMQLCVWRPAFQFL